MKVLCILISFTLVFAKDVLVTELDTYTQQVAIANKYIESIGVGLADVITKFVQGDLTMVKMGLMIAVPETEEKLFIETKKDENVVKEEEDKKEEITLFHKIDYQRTLIEKIFYILGASLPGIKEAEWKGALLLDLGQQRRRHTKGAVKALIRIALKKEEPVDKEEEKEENVDKGKGKIEYVNTRTGKVQYVDKETEKEENLFLEGGPLSLTITVPEKKENIDKGKEREENVDKGKEQEENVDKEKGGDTTTSVGFSVDLCRLIGLYRSAEYIYPKYLLIISADVRGETCSVKTQNGEEFKYKKIDGRFYELKDDGTPRRLLSTQVQPTEKAILRLA